MGRLLLLSCGKRKRADLDLLPALERYDGPLFRVVRRFCATHPLSQPDIYILSAKFGLISANQPIPNYDQRLTPERASELRPAVQETLAQILTQHSYADLYYALGRDYAQSLDGFVFPSSAQASAQTNDIHITIASGSQGRRLAHLHDWLYGPHATAPTPLQKHRNSHPLSTSQTPVQLKGVGLSFTMEQAFAQIRRALAHDAHGSDQFHSWYVLLDGKRIAPKWVVSQLTGLPRSAFTTHEALQALERIGIPPQRNALWEGNE